MDLTYKIDNHSFHARVSAIIYNRDKSKVLLFKVNGRDYYLLPGGKIRFNEDSLTAIKREIREEIGYDLEYTLCSIEENFLKREEENIMQYCFCYKAIYDGKIEKDNFNCLDHDGQTFHWINISEIDNITLFPKISSNYIKNNYDKINHLIERNIDNE
ncbi:MAG: NUDIX domain-containing protein [Erysipelotrichaceae bacterium]|nr:NUDIX domain-containing protein [Erysipelotrichaceae bacterium]